MIAPSLSIAGDRVIDVGSEWRTFSNEKATKDPSRVGDAQNPLLNGGDLTTMISKVRNYALMIIYKKTTTLICIFFSFIALTIWNEILTQVIIKMLLFS